MVNPRGVVGDPDPLGDALHLIRLSGALYCGTDAGAPWGVEVPALPGTIVLVVVLTGSCLLETGPDRIELAAGSAALLTRGASHRLRSEGGVPTLPLFELPTEVVTDRYERMRIGGDGPISRIAYAALRADDVLTARLVAELPDVIAIDGWDDDDAGSFAAILRMLAREAITTRIGGEVMMTRLADVLVLQVIRWWLTSSTRPSTGWLAALDDRHVGRALASMHADTAREWSIADLAARASLSRSAFADRFTTLVGTPPMTYLTGWRLDRARAELERGETSIATVAARVGYTSDAAFARAFKRHHGVTPGEARRHAQPVSARSSPRRLAE